MALDVVRGQGVHVVGVPGVDEDEAGDPPVRTPGTEAVLLQLAVGDHDLAVRVVLRGQQVVVGDLVKQFAILLLGARTYLREKHSFNKSFVNVIEEPDEDKHIV